MRSVFLASVLAIAAIGAAQAKFDPVGKWYPRIHLVESKLRKESQSMADGLRKSAALMKDAWVVIVRRDHTYLLPSKPGGQQSQEGTWFVRGDLFRLQVLKEAGKPAKKGRHGDFTIGPDGNTLIARTPGTKTAAYFEFYRKK